MSDTLTYEKKWAILTAVLATTGVAAGFTFCGPVITLLLERMTGSGTFIGVYAAAGAMTTIVITPFAPRILSKLNFRALIIGCLLLAAATMPAYYFMPVPLIWIAFRFLQGLCLTIVFVACETWINQVAPEAMRGRILALYAMALSGGFAIGSGAAAWVISTFGLDGILPFLIGAAIVSVGVLPFLGGRAEGFVPPTAENASFGNILKICRASPGLIIGGIVFGGIEACMFILLPVYGVRIGLLEGVAATLLFALGIGNILLQWPVGVMADKLNRRKLLIAFMAACIALPFIFFAMGTAFWPLMLTVGLYTGVATGLYTIALVNLGERYKGDHMAAANAALIFAYGLGSFILPLSGGASMDILGPVGLPLILSGFAVAGFVVLLLERRRQKITANAG